jgi:hypothetical protein
MTKLNLDPRSLSAEVAGALLGDPRRNRRHEQVVQAIASSPGESLPDVFDDDSELEATYRLLNNKHIEFDALLEPHLKQTRARAQQVGLVYAVSDTTDFTFSGSERRIGVRQGKAQGFRGHFCLAVTPTVRKKALPLGLLGVLPLFRDGPAKGERDSRERKEDDTRESLRWKELALAVESRLHGQCQLIHVTDREGDIYEFLAALLSEKARFIIRVAQDRLVEPRHPRLFEQLKQATFVCEQEVFVSQRKGSVFPNQRKSHPARSARTAQLKVTATTLTIRRPQTAQEEGLPESLTLNYVHVFEPNPPTGEEPIDWKLMTTEPIATQEQVEAVIVGYRMRWVIEEFFKALKTGCGYEKNQLESRKAVLNYLAVLAPVAWQLLLVRTVAQDEPATPAEAVLPELLLKVLRAVTRRPLSSAPTAQDALFAIAGLGGHIKNNGPPGWLVIGRGFQKLLLLAEGWAARESTET